MDHLHNMQGLSVSGDSIKDSQGLGRGQLMDKENKQHGGSHGSLLALGRVW